jgi:hypothetical protein
LLTRVGAAGLVGIGGGVVVARPLALWIVDIVPPVSLDL